MTVFTVSGSVHPSGFPAGVWRYTHTHTHTYIYIYTHTHTHTHTFYAFCEHRTKDDADVTMRPTHMFGDPASVLQCVSEIVHSLSEANTKRKKINRILRSCDRAS